MKKRASRTDLSAREFPPWRASVSVITGYESSAAAFPRLLPRASRKFVLGRAHNSPLEMAKRDAPRSSACFESLRLESTGGVSGRIRGRGARSGLECPQRLGRCRSQEIHY